MSMLDTLRSFSGTAPSAGANSVLGQQAAARQQATTPQAPVNVVPAQTQSYPMNPSARYGDRSGEQRIDTSQMTRPLLGGLSGVKRK